MPKNPAKAEVNNFVGGLITEVSKLAFPPNASPDIVNFEHNRDGSIQRRLGFDMEPRFRTKLPPDGDNLSDKPDPIIYRWDNVAGISNFTLLCVQFDSTIVFFDCDADSIVTRDAIGGVFLENFPKDVEYSMAAVDGKLVVVAGVERIAIVTYSNGVFSTAYDKLRTRDLWGVEVKGVDRDKYETDVLYRPDSLNPYHIYNLHNQSWALQRARAKLAIDGNPSARRLAGREFHPISLFYEFFKKYPSNSEQVWTGMRATVVGDDQLPVERFYPNLMKDLYGLTSNVSRGFFIIDVVNRGASRKQAVEDNFLRNGAARFNFQLPEMTDYTEGGPSFVTEFAGRLFFGGFTGRTIGGDSRSPNLSNYVFFSQIVKNTSEITKCYQEGDPTSREEADIVDTDGGFLRIAGAERILKMVPLGTDLIAVCSNGVWAIKGGSDYGFTATNYKVDKISSFGCLNANTVVEEKGQVFYWGEDGIFVIGKNEFSDMVVKNLTQPTIDTYYKAIPVDAKLGCKSLSDTYTGKIRWLYYQDGSNYELILDTELGCMYPFKIYNPVNVRIVGMFQTTPFLKSFEDEDVAVGSDTVLSDTEEVYSNTERVGESQVAVKYLVKVGYEFGFGYYRDPGFKDFGSLLVDPVDAKAYLWTGEVTGGDASVRKQIQFLTVYMKRTEVNGTNPSGCISRTSWDWANNSNGLKWSSPRQVYKNTRPVSGENFDVAVSRNMVRGQGRTFSVYFETEPGKDCHIIGWGLAIDGNQRT